MKLILEDIVKKFPKDITLVSEEEIINAIYLTQEESELLYMLVDSENPRSLIGRARLMKYLESQGFIIENLERKPS